jgi:spore germination protein GerM
MDVKRVAILGVLLVLLIILIVVFFKSGGKEKIKQPPPAPRPELQSQPKESGQTKKIVLLFLSEEDDLLHPEEREIIADSSVVRQASQTIEELIKGSEKGYLSPFPPETKLRQLFITKEGVAYVDFSKELTEKHPSGSSAEILTVYSIVNSLTQNFNSIKKVFILVDGGEKETLGGHIDLTRPFLPQYSLIAD